MSFCNNTISSPDIHSSSIALKIQVSGATADLLHTLKGYVLTCRGTLNVKVQIAYCRKEIFFSKSYVGMFLC